jgi:hypothetical protein
VSLPVRIADAVTAELTAGAFSQPIAPVRRVLPEFELADLRDLRVTVVPASLEIEGASRALSQHDVRIDIGIQKKLGKNLDAEVADLCDLVEQIADFLKRRPLAALPYAAWVTTTNDPIYAADHLAQQRVFTSVLSLTYRVMK